MKYITKEVRVWLKEKLNTDTFGLGDMQLDYAVAKTELHLWNAKKTNILCLEAIAENNDLTGLTTTTASYAWHFIQSEKPLCYDCWLELSYQISTKGLSLENYDAYRENLAEVIVFEEKILQKQPKRYTTDWFELIDSYINILRNQFALEYPEEAPELENVFTNSIKHLTTELKKYMKNNPSSLTDPIVQKELLKRPLFTLNKTDLSYLDALGISRKKPLSTKNKAQVREIIKQNQDAFLKTIHLPLEPVFLRQDFETFQEWIKAEAAEQEYRELLLIHEKYLQDFTKLKNSWHSKEHSLLKIEHDADISSNTPDLMYLYMLEAKVENTTSKGVLIPTELILTLKEYFETGFFDLGPVKNTDTLEILETALGLNLEVEKALPTARLLLKEKHVK